MIPITKALSMIKDEDECSRILKDLLTPQEFKNLEERWRVAQILDTEQKSYRDIAKETGVSVTTIGRIARFLHSEPYQGYRILLDRICKTQHNKG